MAAQIVIDFTDAQMLLARQELGEQMGLRTAQGEPRSATQNEVKRFLINTLKGLVQSGDLSKKHQALTPVEFDPQ
jgi:hypothetical protein